MRRFEWNQEKSHANQIKHGIDFKIAKGLWLDDNRVEIQVPHPVESRKIIIAALDQRLWTAIYTMRKDAVRIISVRRAREKEERLYAKEKTS